MTDSISRGEIWLLSHRCGMRCGSMLATAAKLIGGTAGPGGLACGVNGAETGAEMASCDRDVVGWLGTSEMTDAELLVA